MNKMESLIIYNPTKNIKWKSLKTTDWQNRLLLNLT